MRRVTSERAARLGAYPSLATASSTAACASGETRSPPFTARDAVDRDTFAALATSSSVGLLCSVLTTGDYSSAPGRAGTAFAAATVAYQRPEALTVRSCVS
ncbi:hypothetical protein GCM10007368_27810 [Isoptericola cucumis]|uniref:Uncharacterized protein n=1 Tax=Isoptericola cucumis TaxID=1776856 RepID=A0ABQ2B7W8_9MICO|nr:hypothetical protein GCM10007368_27810 [Isoptericola cucumis]